MPVVQVESPKKTAEYYRDVLGFEFDYGTDGYAVVWRDNAAIHFIKDEKRASGVKIFLWVKNADEVRAELGKRARQSRPRLTTGSTAFVISVSPIAMASSW